MISPVLRSFPRLRYERNTDGYERIRTGHCTNSLTIKCQMISAQLEDTMGNILSGNRQPRERKDRTTATPRVCLTHANLYAVKGSQDTVVVPDTNGWAIVRYHCREWVVELSHTALHFGGQRRWMLCPKCKSRRQTLYISSDTLACRTCLDLRYESQSESLRARRLRQIEKIRHRLGWPAGLLACDGCKPVRMHWKTYAALRRELAGLTDLVVMNMLQWVDRAEQHLIRHAMQQTGPRAAPAAEGPPQSGSEGR